MKRYTTVIEWHNLKIITPKGVVSFIRRGRQILDNSVIKYFVVTNFVFCFDNIKFTSKRHTEV